MPVAAPVKVGIVENHPMYRDALTRQFSDAQCVVVAAADSTETLGPDAEADIVVCDLYLVPPARSGGDAVRYLRDNGYQVLATSGVASPAEALDAIACGASGFVEKNTRSDAFVDAAVTIADGHCYADPYLARYLLDDADHRRLRRNDIGNAERAVLRALAQGDRIDEIAMARGIERAEAQALLDRAFEAGRRRRAMHRPSPRETEVIRLIGRQGLSHQQAAHEIGIAPSTVAEILTSVRFKYLASHPDTRPDITPRTAAEWWARELGTLPRNP